jgi:uncharacterized protein YbcI
MAQSLSSEERARIAGAVSNAIVALHRDHYGRGADRTRTVVHPDAVICFLEDPFTPVERTLLDAGKFEDVRRTRQVFQDAMAGRFTSAVEEITGRKVRAFFSQIHADPDVAAEAFLLEPAQPGSSTDGSPS